jgi:hypothetical protein
MKKLIDVNSDELKGFSGNLRVPVDQNLINRYLGKLKYKNIKNIRMEIIGDKEIVIRFKEKLIFSWNDQKFVFFSDKRIWTAHSPWITFRIERSVLGFEEILKVFGIKISHKGFRINGNMLEINISDLIQRYIPAILEHIKSIELNQEGGKLFIQIKASDQD